MDKPVKAAAASPPAVIHRAEYGRNLVVDIDLDLEDPVIIMHSLHSHKLIVSFINIGGGNGFCPTFIFPSENEMHVTMGGIGSSELAKGGGRFRIFITVSPY